MLLRFTTLLFIAAVAWCADPFVGTWKLDLAKSQYTTGRPPKSMTVTTTEALDSEDTTVTVTTADGTEISYRFRTPIKGGAGTVVQGVGFDAVTAKQINATTRETTFSKEGKQVRTVRAGVAKDGRTMTTTVRGVDAQGKPVDAHLVSEKQ